MNLFLIILVSWVLCAIFTYFVLRWDWKRSFNNSWTKGNRRFSLLASMFGPISVMVAIIVLLVAWGEEWSKKHNGDFPAKW